ncbi:hypothetical protein BGZ94_002834 [Podila epigama]|nr:hypothetical protein BGZ94_002834 [Podila epigama]
MKALQLYVQNRPEALAQTLAGMNDIHRSIRIMLETLFENLPKDVDRSVSEFTVKHIGQVMQALFQSKNVTSHFPNKDSSTQKKHGLKPDRPDFTATTTSAIASLIASCPTLLVATGPS